MGLISPKMGKKKMAPIASAIDFGLLAGSHWGDELDR